MLRLGLGPITEALQRLHNPHHAFLALHVAGTNGKGSTCALLEAALLACLSPAGLRVGKFVSPFLVEPRDAVWLDGAPLPAEAWAAALREVDAAAAAAAAAPALQLTPFERWTAAAFVAFAAAGVGVAVVEVGVGGGGDATNALPPPLLALVTPLAMDHVDLLGPTLADIAGHKAGIFKAGGGGALCAPGQAPEALAVLHARARAVGLALVVAPALPWERRGVLRVEAAAAAAAAAAPPLLLPLGLAGDFQATNASLAWAALQELGRTRWPALLDGAAIGAAWRTLQWRGRMERVQLRVPRGGGSTGKAAAATAAAAAGGEEEEEEGAEGGEVTLTCTLDGGHNAHAMEALAAELAWQCSEAAAAAAAAAATAAAAEGRQQEAPPAPQLALVFACGAARNAHENISLLLGGLWQRLPALRVAVFTVPYALPEGMPWVASQAPEALAGVVRAAAPRAEVQAASSVVAALQAIAGSAALRGAGACRAICGSLYLVSDVARLGQLVAPAGGQ
jgi:folylpolyglutamate synthase/dihydrofolate synthase